MSALAHPGAAMLSGLAKWFTGADVLWHWQPSESRPRIYFANHSSHLDALVLLAALPEPIRSMTHPVADREYWERSGLRSFLANRIFGSVLVSKAAASPFAGRGILRGLLHQLERGRSLILFPEGTRGTGEQIGDFKSGLFQLCRQRAGLEAVPVYLGNLNRILPKGHFIPALAKSRVVFGRPLQLAAGEAKPEFLERARHALEELKPQ